jgi:hypothetical protein
VSEHKPLSLHMSDRLLATQREIHYFHTQLANTEDTLRAHQRMHAGQDSDFYSLDQDTWTAMLSIVGIGEEPLVDSHLPSGPHTR